MYLYRYIYSTFTNNKFIEFGKAAKYFSENFHWNKVIKNYLKLIN